MALINELRIGNTVSVDGLFITVESINSEGINIFVDDDVLIEYASFGDDDYHVKPISLTEEWLIKFDFGYKSKSSCTEWSIGLFSLTTDHEDEYGDPTDGYDKFYYSFEKEVKYVHQLQNLYFALTGEELNVINNG